MTIVMIVTIRLLSNAAIDYEISKELNKSTKLNAQNLSIEDGELVISDGFLYESDEVRFVIINRDGDVLEGEYPKEVFDEIGEYSIENNRNHAIVCGGRKYYFRDARIGRDRNEKIYLRGIIKKSDADSFYRGIEVVSYLSLLGVVAVILIFEIFLSKRISSELKSMCRTAESIGSNLDMSQRMECDNRFYEIAILAQANNRMMDRLEQTFQMQEQFTSDVAHELRTPVSVMLAQCEYARKNAKSQKEFDEIVDTIYRQSKKINEIITQLLNFSRLEQDRVRIQNETLDLTEIVQSVCEDQQVKSEGKVVFHFHLEDAVTIGDIGLISIVIQNLVSNAVKFSRPDSRIDVAAGERDGEVFVSVKDYGVGIEAEKLNHIFRRFYQCDKSRSAEGFGLGLSLSEKIAEKHGGKIEVSSEPGKGSEFTLYLPKKQVF